MRSDRGPSTEQQHDWERAHKEIERAERQLGRDLGAKRDIGLEIGF